MEGIRKRPVMALALLTSVLWAAASAYELLIKNHPPAPFAPAGWYSAVAAVLAFVTAFMIERVFPGLVRPGREATGSRFQRPPDESEPPLALGPGR